MADQARLYSANLVTPYYVDLDVLSVRGSSEPDSISKFPGIVHEMLDGSLSEQIAGGRRNIVVEFQTMTAAQRRKVILWWLDPARQIRTTNVADPGVTGLNVTGSAGGSLTNGVAYYYRVAALDTIGESIGSEPDDATASGANLSMSLAWGAVTGARRYKIYRKIAVGGTYYLHDYSETNSYIDDGSQTSVKVASALATESRISVISSNELSYEWAHETEIARILTLEVREASIFLSASGFPV